MSTASAQRGDEAEPADGEAEEHRGGEDEHKPRQGTVPDRLLARAKSAPRSTRPSSISTPARTSGK